MHQCTCHGKNTTTHASHKIEHNKNILDDSSIKVGGGQHVTTLHEHKIYISIRDTLSYMPLRPHTDT